MPKNQIVFVVTAVAVWLGLQGLTRRLESAYARPGHFIPVRHLIQPADYLRTQSPLREVSGSFSIEASDLWGAGTSLALRDIRGVRLLLATSRRPVASNLILNLSGEGFLMQCRSTATKALVDGDWTDFMLDCDGADQRTLFDLAAVEVELPGAAGTGIQIYGLTQRMESGTGMSPDAPAKAALLFFHSRYPDDRPPLSFEAALNYGGLWHPGMQGALRGVAAALWSLAIGWLAVLAAQAWQRRREAYGSGGTASGISRQAPWLLALFWVCAVLQYLTVNPPLQSPDEPQHVLGVIKGAAPEALPAAEADLIGIADRTTFLVSAQTRDVPVLQRELAFPSGLGDSHFLVDHEGRSRLYRALSAPLARLGLWAYGQRALGSDDLTLYLRFALFLPALLLVVAGFAAHIALGRRASAAFLMLALLNPIALSIGLSVSNYSWAVFAGCVLCSFLIPERNARWPLAAPFAAAALLPLAADSTQSSAVLLFAVPFIGLLQLFFLFERVPSDKPSLPRKILVLTGFNVLCAAILLLQDPFSQAKLKSAGRLLKSLCGQAGIAAASCPRATPDQAWWLGAASVLAMVLLSASLLWRSNGAEGAPAGDGLGVAARWRLTFGLMAAFIVAAGLLHWKYPDPLFMPNIYGQAMTKPPLAEFLALAVKALASQSVHFTQDYFLWQTHFFAFGWLDTSAAMGYYFVLRQVFNLLLLGCGLALIWRTRAFLLACLPAIAAFSCLFALTLAGGWVANHTALGRYALPAWGFMVMPLLLAQAFLWDPRCYENVFARFCFVAGVFNAGGCLYAVHWVLVKRFVIGG